MKLKLKGYFVILPFFFVMLAGCATWQRTFFASDLTRISLGENKMSVVQKLGGVASPIASEIYEGHQFEILEFVEKPFYMGRANKAYWTRYWVYFMDGKLVKYEKAMAADLIEHQKWIQNVMVAASTMEAFKGTALSPYQMNVTHSGQVNVDANVHGNVNVSEH